MDLIYLNSQKIVAAKETKSGFQLNDQNHSIQIPEKEEVNLTHLEYKLLALLFTQVNQAFTYEDIHTKVWTIEKKTEFSEKKYRIANMVFHIRKKLKRHGINPNVLRTVRSIGYLLDTNIETTYNERGDDDWRTKRT